MPCRRPACQVGGQIAASEDPAVDLGMQGLDPSPQDLRLARVVGDLGDLQSRGERGPSRASAGQQRDVSLGQGAGQLEEPALVRDAEQGSLNRDDL